MRMVVVAATGGIGRQLVQQAVAAGHEVTAVVRRPDVVLPAARTVVVDLAVDSLLLADAFVGAEAVLSGLGPRSKADLGVCEDGTLRVIAAMHEAGVRRLVVVSAAPVGTVASPGNPHPPRHDEGEGLLMRTVLTPVLKRVLSANYADLARMEDAVRESGLEWTIVRPPRLTDRPLTGRYRTAVNCNVRRGFAISRADVAHAMLASLDQPEQVGEVLAVAA